MKFNFFSLLLFVAVCSISCSEPQKTIWRAAVDAPNETPALVPLPNEVNWGEKAYVLANNNSISYNEGARTAASWLQELLEQANTEAVLNSEDSTGNMKVVLNDSLEKTLGKEGYILDIDEKGITLKGATNTGLFYGVQTLSQFFPAKMARENFNQDSITLRQTHIVDAPFYSWRGNMVDVARSFFDLEYLKDHVDRMAAYKLNRLHLHLTDDQGWRIEIKSRPKLTEIGAKSAVVDGRSGFLTQEEYIELQNYAAARNIVIIPEIDMPGHIYAALRSYPELNCEGNSNIAPGNVTYPEPYQKYAVGWSELCLEKTEVVYSFVDDVISELASITKGPWIHIGGDEIETELYEEFVAKADSIVQSYGKTSIGWQEVLKGEVDSTLIAQWWHKQPLPNKNNSIIASICSSFYLDHGNVPGQENTNNWCKEDGVSIKNVYSFKTDRKDMLGVEAAVWSEFVINDDRMDDKFWPRNLAVAEVAWTQPKKRDYNDFMKRVDGHTGKLQAMGIAYFATPELDWGNEEIAESPKTIFSGFMPEILLDESEK